MTILPVLMTLAISMLQGPRASIDGTVLDASSGSGLGNAQVALSPVSPVTAVEAYVATTDANGRFAFGRVLPGQYHLAAVRDGYLKTEHGQRGPNGKGQPIAVAAGQSIKGLALKIIPTSTITGRITNRDGEVIANATVEAFKYTLRDGQSSALRVQRTQTNDLGEYRLFWLQPGQYYVTANRLDPYGVQAQLGQGRGVAIDASGPMPAPNSGQTRAFAESGPGFPGVDAYAPVYFPNASSPQGAELITLLPGAVATGVDLILTPVHHVVIRGRTTSTLTGNVPGDACPRLIPRSSPSHRDIPRTNLDPAQISCKTVDAQGAFEITTRLPGSYYVYASSGNNYGATPIEITDKDIDNVVLTLKPTFDIRGRLIVEGTPPPPRPRTVQPPPRIQVTLDEVTGQKGAPVTPGNFQPDGPFEVSGIVDEGEYRLNVTGLGATQYIKSARLGAIDVLNSGLRLNGSEHGTALLEIVTAFATAVVDGVVVDDKSAPADSITVVLVPDGGMRSRFDLYRTISTDTSGQFRFNGVPPGNYKLFSWGDVAPDAWKDPEFLRAFEVLGRAISVGTGTSVTLQLKLIP